MQKLLTAIFLVTVSCPICLSQAQQKREPRKFLNPVITSKDGATITATSDKLEYRGDEPIKYSIILKNTGDKPFVIFPSDVEWFYSISVIGPDGREIPFKKPRRPAYKGLLGSSQNDFFSLDGEDLRPRETKKALVWLTNLFDMSEVGSYKIVASTTFRLGTEGSTFLDIKSEPITVKVVSSPTLSEWVE